ncbi:23S rRNA (uracil(1939)-C(5))-methyltransferase RlmD [bacterium 210820-DFI.6.37]|nr:23S rRNA (uracil(1939)-C(5))-methyltransferase RlmD [bacterium 210820-DFI.6.37]
MFEKGQTHRVEIIDISDQGQGIGRSDGMAVFVPGTVVGDIALVQLTKVKKNYALARLLEVETPSENRIEPLCSHGLSKGCGGCALACLDYPAQLSLKEKQVRDKLTRLGGLADPVVKPIIGMDVPFSYRNKAQFPVSTGGIITRKGGIVENLGDPAVGFYKLRSHEVVDCQDCMLQSPAAMAAADALRRFMKEDNITAWDERWEKGLMRHLVVKTAFGTGEVMVILVINGKGIPNGQKLVEMLDDAIYEAGFSLESVILNINKKKSSEILGEDCVTLAGKPTILETIGDMSFEISPMSFYQVNPAQMEKLYAKALEYAALTGEETVLDLYCGVGTIGLYCAGAAKQVVGIESVRNAVLDANRNAVINGIVNARFLCGRAEEELPRLLQTGDSARQDADDVIRSAVQSADVVILDPPRAGCRPELLEAVAKAAPDRIVYVSCDPATLARDVKLLGQMGYRFVEATPVDMFPWTGCVETVVLLFQQKPDDRIEVEIELDELDLTSAESKATYKEIQEYVLEKYGLKVSNLYISQVKRKCGIEVGENYNLPKSEDSRQPQCPEEKEKAIRDALEHFGMV